MVDVRLYLVAFLHRIVNLLAYVAALLVGSVRKFSKARDADAKA